MPIPLLWNVKLNRNAKISVAGVLGLGFFASLSACVRLRYTIGLTEQENYLGECNIVPETPPSTFELPLTVHHHRRSCRYRHLGLC